MAVGDGRKNILTMFTEKGKSFVFVFVLIFLRERPGKAAECNGSNGCSASPWQCAFVFDT